MGGGGCLPGLQTAGEGAPQGGRTNQRSLTHSTLANRRRPFYSLGRLGEVLWDSGNIPQGEGTNRRRLAQPQPIGEAYSSNRWGFTSLSLAPQRPIGQGPYGLAPPPPPHLLLRSPNYFLLLYGLLNRTHPVHMQIPSLTPYNVQSRNKIQILCEKMDRFWFK
jgi:hypothetical protein